MFEIIIVKGWAPFCQSMAHLHSAGSVVWHVTISGNMPPCFTPEKYKEFNSSDWSIDYILYKTVFNIISVITVHLSIIPWGSLYQYST